MTNLADRLVAALSARACMWAMLREGEESIMEEQINVGDLVTFTDEFGNERTSHVTHIVPAGEYAKDEPAYALEGTYGSYVRVRAEIKKVKE